MGLNTCQSSLCEPRLVLFRVDFEMFVYLSTYSFFSLLNKYLMSECLLDLKSHEYRDWGGQSSTPSCVACRRTSSRLCNSSSHFTALSLFSFLQSEDSAFPTNHWMVVKFKWDNVCTNAFKVERIIIEMYIFPNSSGSCEFRGPIGYGKLQCAEDKCVTACEYPGKVHLSLPKSPKGENQPSN